MRQHFLAAASVAALTSIVNQTPAGIVAFNGPVDVNLSVDIYTPSSSEGFTAFDGFSITGDENARHGFDFGSSAMQVLAILKGPQHSEEPLSIDGPVLQALCDQVAQQSQGRQFIMMADQGVRHIFIEVPQHMQMLYDSYASGNITREMFDVICSSAMSWIHTTDETMPRFLDAHARLVETAAAFGISVHCADTGPGDFDPEFKDEVAAVMEGQVLEFIHMLQDSPELIGVFDKIPELKEKLNMVSIERGIKDMNLTEKLDHLDGLVWSEEEGGPSGFDGMLAYRLEHGDSEVAARIAELAAGERAIVVYGKGHMMRTHCDLDDILGDDNCYVIDLYANRDGQHFSSLMADAGIAELLMTSEPFEKPEATICLSTQTWIAADDSFIVYGHNGPPELLTDEGLVIARSHFHYDGRVTVDPIPFDFGRTVLEDDWMRLSDSWTPASNLPDIIPVHHLDVPVPSNTLSDDLPLLPELELPFLTSRLKFFDKSF